MSQQLCPSCNAPNDASAAFCGSCGAPLREGQAAASTPSASSGVTPAPNAQPEASPYAPPASIHQAPAQAGSGVYQPGYQAPVQQPGHGYAPGMDPGASRALHAAQAAGLIIPAGYVPAGFWPRLGAYLIDAIIVSLFSWIPVLGFLGAIAYLVGFWGAKGQTPGKMLLGLYVISTDGQPLSYGKAFLRWLGYMVSGLTLGIGFLMIGFDDAKRGLHDRIAGTLVVKRAA